MKKLLLLLVIVGLGLTVNAQKFKPFYISFNIEDVTGSDTTIYRSMQSAGPLGFILDSATYTGTGATLDLLVSNSDTMIYSPYVHKDLPFTLDGNSQPFEKSYMPFRFLGFKITFNSTSAGAIRIYGNVKFY